MPERSFHEIPLDGGEPNLKVWQEKRHFAPSDYGRAKILKYVPFGQRGRVEYLNRGDVRYVRTGQPDKMNDPQLNTDCEDRIFTDGNDRDRMAKVMMINQPQSFEIIAFWEPLPKDADMKTSIITLVTQAVLRDKAAPGKPKGDGLDGKTVHELRTMIGMAGIKGPDGKAFYTEKMSQVALVQTLRDFRNEKAQGEKKAVANVG